MDASKNLNDPAALGNLLKEKGISMSRLNEYLKYLDMPVIGGMVKSAAKSIGLDIEAVIKDIKACLNPSERMPNRYERRHPPEEKINKYANIKYKR